MLEGTFYRSDEDTYLQSWDVLNKCYGHPFVIQGSVKPLTSSVDVTRVCHRISVKEMITPASVIKALEKDFLDTNPREGSVSQEDIQFL